MKALDAYENFPARIAILSNFVALSIYAAGIYIMAGCGIWWALLYLLYCGWIELRVLTKSCVDCYYYGKICGFGKGKLCSWLFKKGDPEEFATRQIRWLDLVPEFMVLLFPLAGGIVALASGFNWVVLVVLIVLVVLSLAGNAFVRGSFACKYCKQKELGCPAEKLFNKAAAQA